MGGAVLQMGAAQGEIMMVCRPEVLVTIFLAARLEPKEALVVQNVRTFATTTGYGATLCYVGPISTNKDSLLARVIAMDVVPWFGDAEQWKETGISREAAEGICWIC